MLKGRGQSYRCGGIAGVLFFGLCFLSVQGCMFRHAVRSKVSRPEVLVQGQIRQPDQLRAGGAVLIVPFSPGEAVAAGSSSEALALRMVRGMADILGAQGFTVLSRDSAGAAQLVVKGRLLEYDVKPAGWLRKGRVAIAVEGEMMDVESGRPVAHFKHRRDAGGRELPEVMAEQMGADIGHFLTKDIR